MKMNHDFDEQFLYLTTIGRKTGLPREIEIWFVELNNRLYVLAEHGYKAKWVQNVIANPSVTIRLATRSWNATGRVLEPETDELYVQVREPARSTAGEMVCPSSFGWSRRCGKDSPMRVGMKEGSRTVSSSRKVMDCATVPQRAETPFTERG